jgi:hypothetical protein
MGKVEELKHEPVKRFDPKNPLCPGKLKVYFLIYHTEI